MKILKSMVANVPRVTLISFICVLWFSLLFFFSHHPHVQYLNCWLRSVLIIKIKMCLDFFIASSICVFCSYQKFSLRFCADFCVECTSAVLKDWTGESVNRFIDDWGSCSMKYCLNTFATPLSKNNCSYQIISLFFMGVKVERQFFFVT